MVFEDAELLADFIVEAKEHLADIENQFLQIEENGAQIDIDLVNEVFRAIHSIKGAAGFMGLRTVNDLSHNLENLLNKMRNNELSPTSAIVDVMLRGADALTGLINDIENSNDIDVSEHITALKAIDEGTFASEEPEVATPEPTAPEPVVPEPTAPEPAPIPEIQEVCQQEKAPPVEPAKKKNPKSTAAPAVENSIRVSVGVLDSLMNLAGELVLSRNQLIQAVSSDERVGLEAISARVDQVTSDLQESIMQTRMQPIGSVFGKFPRIVRDLSSKLGKQCDLVIEGKEVEVDKTIIEAIGDPMTHLIRNSVDHGVEMPAKRAEQGKPEKGTIYLRACYQAGKVRIEIQDDGAGIPPDKLKEKALSKGIITPEQAAEMSDRDAVRLIFAPGFSMAKEVTDVSGRGVGMDVVRTNISKLGGTVDVESVTGQGSSIIITLPLTLAIIPSLIVQVDNDRFAIPQVNIAELVRVRSSEREARLGRVKNAEVLRLRGNLLPLLRLRDALGLENSKDQEGSDLSEEEAINIIVVETGQTRFGLIVDGLHDSEEIVVKPLGRHCKSSRCLSGATILGDGHVALILDVAGIAANTQLRSGGESLAEKAAGSLGSENSEDEQAVLLFRNHPKEHFAVSMDLIARIERIRTDQIDSVGGQELLQYRSTTLPLLRLENSISAEPAEIEEHVYVVVFNLGDREVGLVAPSLDDICSVPTDVDTMTFREKGVIGSVVIEEHATRLINLFELAELAHSEWFEDREVVVCNEEGRVPHILLAEDSAFFRRQVQGVFEEQGYRVEACEDGLIAWEKLASGAYDFDIVVTDIEMPNMNGFELCQRIKDAAEHKHLPVIALTSLAASADIQRGIDVGIDDYQIKMDREKLLTALQNFVDCSKPTTKDKIQPKQTLAGSPA